MRDSSKSFSLLKTSIFHIFHFLLNIFTSVVVTLIIIEQLTQNLVTWTPTAQKIIILIYPMTESPALLKSMIKHAHFSLIKVGP